MESARLKAAAMYASPDRSTRGVETVDRIRQGVKTAENSALLDDLCQTMKFGSLCALGGFAPYPVLSAMRHFGEDFGPRALAAGIRKTAMSLINEVDYGTPASRSEKLVTLTIDGVEVRAPEGTSIMRAAMEMGTEIPSSRQ